MRWFKKILVDTSVADYPLTGRFLDAMPSVSITYISPDEAGARLRGSVAEASQLPGAKQTMLITRNTGSFLKYMGNDPCACDVQRSVSWRLELIQGCPADCSYCFCQQYLSCHHVVVFANVDDMQSSSLDTENARIVTGDITDSLALGNLSIIAHEYASSFLPDGCRIELRSKFTLPPKTWERLDPDRFQLDWSLAPFDQWRMNEHGTPDPSRRIASVAEAARSGFKVGIRLDPLQPDAIDREAYKKLLTDLKKTMKTAQPNAFIIGSYKMSPELLEKIRARFPVNPLPACEWSRCADGKLRPFKPIRMRSYKTALGLIAELFPEVPVFVSMEPFFVLNLISP